AVAARRSPGGQNSSTAVDDEPSQRHRLTAPSPVLRGRAVFAAVALGAIAAATAGQSLLPKSEHHGTTYLADSAGMSAVIGTNADDEQSLEVQPVGHSMDASAEAQQIAESQRITGQQS